MAILIVVMFKCTLFCGKKQVEKLTENNQNCQPQNNVYIFAQRQKAGKVLLFLTKINIRHTI